MCSLQFLIMNEILAQFSIKQQPSLSTCLCIEFFSHTFQNSLTSWIVCVDLSILFGLHCVCGPIRLSILGRYNYEILQFYVKDCLQWNDLGIDLRAATVLGLRPRANT